MYDTHRDPKSDATKHFLFKVRRMLQHIQMNIGLFWYPARYLIISEQTSGYQGRHKDKVQIMFKYSGDGFQADDVCDSGYKYSFISPNYDISDSK